MALTALEQYAIELANRARLDPVAEARRYGIDLNAGLPAGSINGNPMQVLAPNVVLETAANRHGEWMNSTATFSHYEGTSGAYYLPGDRMATAGYSFVSRWGWGENIAAVDIVTRTAAEAISAMHRGWMESPLHRQAMLDADFRELGYAQVLGRYQGMDVSFGVQNFAYSGTNAFVTGVVYSDSDRDSFYSIGEGQSGLSFKIIGGNATTPAAAGGYALGGRLGSTLTVQIGSGDAATRVTTSLADGNVKLDVVNGNLLRVAGDVTLLNDSAIRNITALGRSASDLTGNNVANILTGSLGRNVLDGLDGSDTLRGNDGADLLRGGAGSDRLEGGSGNDYLNGNLGWDRLVGGTGADRFVLNNGGGVDRVADFRTAQADTLVLDDALWTRTLTEKQVVTLYADVVAGGVLFDFGGGDRILLEGLTSVSGLAAAIDII